MNTNKEKLAIFQNIKEKLLSMLSAAQESVRFSQSEANFHIGAMQSRYDTFKEEAQYLATAQKIRSFKLEESIRDCEKLIERLSSNTLVFSAVEPGALVVIGDDNQPGVERCFLIVPACAGDKISIGGKQVLCVTPDAPVIKPFIGLVKGDYPDIIECDRPLDSSYIDSIY
ncbi:hypothetical protein [Pseudomonas sp. FSL R10-2398]|uniref:hypothetical protein n=1 Tax=Pseudomonas sp. FSL R10-2398 TaxID=2662201 RepID=UPI001297CD28|nr:hypothetical protein [Pseudomonas sp. FSL R10-2398]MQT53760.1 hypothetical protein [Pseudomonas sp. FSL R10-2398]